MSKVSKKESWLVFLLCAIIAFVFLIFCSCTSFIFKYTHSIDFNWYELMGRAILNHKVPYRDIFEHKGPALYFMFAFFVLLGNVRLVVFIVEVLLGAVFLFFSYKMLRKFFNIELSIFLTIFVAFCTYTSNSFNMGGDNVDEYVLPLLSFMVYWFHGYLEDPEKHDLKWWQSIIIGFGLGFILLSKYTILILPGILLVNWLIYELLKKRQRAAIKNLLFMFLGFAVIVVPILIYFAINGALGDLINVYLLINLRYSSAANHQTNSVLEDLILSVPNLLMFLSFIFIAVLLVREAYVHDKKYVLLLLPGIISVTVYLLFLRNIMVYYYHMFAVYLPIAIIFVLKGGGHIFERIFKRKFSSPPNFLKHFLFVVFSAMLVVLSTGFSSMSRYIYGRNYLSYPYIEIANAIQEYSREEKSVYCYGLMDNSIYNLLQITPDEYFYSKNLFARDALPEMFEGFDKVVLSGKYDFVVASEFDVLNNEAVFVNYETYTQRDFLVLLINKNLLKN